VPGVAKALVLSFLDRYTTMVVGLLANVLLSRLLTPHDIGLFSLGMAISALLFMFRDFGVTTYVVQEPELDAAKFRTVFGVSLTSCAIVLVVLLGMSCWAWWYFPQRAIGNVLAITSLSLLFMPFNALVMAWQRRQMRFHILYRMSLVGILCHATTGVSLALLGFGYLALPWASIANNFGTALVALRYRPRHLSWRPSLHGWRSLGAFGVFSTVDAVGQEITARATDILVGSRIGIVAVGEYSKGNGLTNMVSDSLVTAILPVAVSALAQKRRAGEALAQAWLAMVAMVSGVAWPAFALVGLLAYPIIRILFGTQWDMAVTPAHFLAVAAMFNTLITTHRVAFRAMGAMRISMTVQLAVTPPQLAVLFVGLYWGLPGVACATILSSGMEAVVAQIAVNRTIGTHVGGLLAATWKSVLVTLGTLALPLIVVLQDPPGPDNIWTPLVLAGFGGAIGWLVSLLALGHPLATELRRRAPDLMLRLRNFAPQRRRA
jgi:O-antigen/teichoic acid export membrane protein